MVKLRSLASLVAAATISALSLTGCGEKAPSEKTYFLDAEKKVPITFVRIPGQKYTLTRQQAIEALGKTPNSSDREKGFRLTEKGRDATLEILPYWIAKTEITERQYLTALRATDYLSPNGAENPITNLRIRDARRFNEVVSGSLNLELTLPTEIQVNMALGRITERGIDQNFENNCAARLTKELIPANNCPTNKYGIQGLEGNAKEFIEAWGVNCPQTIGISPYEIRNDDSRRVMPPSDAITRNLDLLTDDNFSKARSPSIGFRPVYIETSNTKKN